MAFDLDDEENEATRIANGASKERKEENMDIKVGEYVRTKDGYLGILIAINKQDYNYLVVDTSIEVRKDGYPSTYLYLKKENIKKYSKQLIDLIEVGDYVNEREVKHIAMFEGFPNYPKLIFVDETHLIPDDTCENDEIKTVLTKEQFEANCYKVGGKQWD